MSHLEMDLRKQGLLPKIWWRYVDDVFSVIKRDEVDDLIHLLNNRYTSINFTYEIENNKTLHFLDLSLIRKDNGIEFDIYRKPSNTSRYITSDSFCPTSHKLAAFHSMVYRLINIPLSIQNYKKEIETIKEYARINGYKESIIDKLVQKHEKQKRNKELTTFKKENSSNMKRVCFNYAPPLTNKISNILYKHKYDTVYNGNKNLKGILGNNKDKIIENDKEGIYEITCKCNNCEMKYIGQTRRNIGTRFKEHMSHIRNNHPEKSAVASHAFSKNHSKIDDYDLKLLKYVPKQNQLDCWESLHMHKNLNSMNIDNAPIKSSLFNFSK